MTKSPKKILYLCADPGIPFQGTKGSSIHVRHFLQTMMDYGNEMIVIARQQRGGSEVYPYELYNLPKLKDKFVSDQLIKLAGNKDHFKELGSFYRNHYIERKLKQIYRDNPFDLIYERYSLFNTAGLNFARRVGIPFLLEVNAPLVQESANFRSLEMAGVSQAVEKYLFRYADQILPVSETLRDYILDVEPNASITVVPNGFAEEKFADIDRLDTVESKKTYGYSKSDFVIGFIGRLRPWHGVDILIDSFAKVVDLIPGGKLAIVGDNGGLKADLIDRCCNYNLNGTVNFFGAVEHEKVPSLLSSMDILVAPYPKIDNFYFSALKLFEYMAAGKAIIASDIGQISKIIDNEKTGLLVPPGDIDAIGQAILKLYDNKNLRDNLGANARREALALHTWGKRLRVVDDLMDQLIETAKGDEV